MPNKYKLNYYSFFSQDHFDYINEGNILVYSTKTQKKYRINKTGYVILKYIESNPLVSLLEVNSYLLSSEALNQVNDLTALSSINSFLNFCIDLEILYTE